VKTYWVNGGIAPHILNLWTRRRWLSASQPGRFNPWERSIWYPFDRRLDMAEREKIPSFVHTIA